MLGGAKKSPAASPTSKQMGISSLVRLKRQVHRKIMMRRKTLQHRKEQALKFEVVTFEIVSLQDDMMSSVFLEGGNCDAVACALLAWG